MKLGSFLPLERCPRCNRHRPTLKLEGGNVTAKAYDGTNPRYYYVFVCAGCGGAVLASCAVGANGSTTDIDEVVPSPEVLGEAIPARTPHYLAQARESLHAPEGAVMLAASAVDATLKEKGYKDGNLYPRINKAVEDHLLTPDMALWAH